MRAFVTGVQPCALPIPRGRAVAVRAFADRVGAAAFFPRRAVIDPGEAEHVRAGAFHVAQVIGVIDHPRQIGVLEIDAQRKAVLAPDEAAFRGIEAAAARGAGDAARSEEHTSELQSLMRISYAVFCLKKTKNPYTKSKYHHRQVYTQQCTTT